MGDGRGDKILRIDFTGSHLQRPTDSQRRDAMWLQEPPSDAPPPYEPPEDDEPDDRPTIEVRGGYIAHTIDAAEAALLASGLPIFERGKMLVYPIVSTLPAADDLKTDVWTLKPMQTENVVYMLNKRAARFTRYDVRKKTMVLIDPPDNVARGLLAKGRWTFPTITGVTTVPTMRPDGVLLGTPGYDEATQLWFAPDRHLVIKPLKAEPTRKDAQEALALLVDLLAEFPFVAPLDRSVSLAALLAPVLRGAFDVGPMIFTRAHTAGTGKSFFTNVSSVLVTGQRCPVITEAKREELEKNRLHDSRWRADNLDRQLPVRHRRAEALPGHRAVNDRHPHLGCLPGRFVRVAGHNVRQRQQCRLHRGHDPPRALLQHGRGR